MPTDLSPNSFGRDLRAIRKSRGLTLTDLASSVDRSIGWLSQVERDISSPSMDEIKRLSAALKVPLSTFFGRAPARAGEEGRIVRAEARRAIGGRVTGLAEELLSPDLTDDFEMVHSTFAPGASRSRPVSRPTQELAFIVSGSLEVSLGGENFHVGAGDSFRIRGEPFTWANKSDEVCVAIWVIAPPVY